jgi:predicted Rossmann fold nucleotide-binding protein DprA/Smf involved in DNA uptake
VSLSKQVGKVADRLNKLQSSKKTSSVKKKKKAIVKSKSAAKKAKTSKTKKMPGKEKTVLDTVFEVIKRSRNGVSIDKLKEKTGLISRQLSNALYKLAKKGNIKSKGRGLYVKK